jgi:uncharacterized protein (DUF1778 family)
MKETDSPASRRRAKRPLVKKTFVYFTEDERKLVDRAAKLERRSVSSFVANAVLRVAEEIASKATKNKK